jgi:hypothetical protein
MAEALAVVGIVANIVQLVDFGTRVLKRLNEYQSSLAEIPEAFRNIKSELPVLLDALRQTKAAIDAGLLQDESKKALIPAVEGCGVQIKELDTIIEKVLPVLSDSWARRSRKALRSLRSEAKVERIVAAIRGYVQTLTYHGVASSKTPAGKASLVPRGASIHPNRPILRLHFTSSYPFFDSPLPTRRRLYQSRQPRRNTPDLRKACGTRCACWSRWRRVRIKNYELAVKDS